MKRFFTFAICILSFIIVKADQPFVTDTSITISNANKGLQKNYRDTLISQLHPAAGYYQNSIYKLRLDSIQKEVQLDYNQFVQDYIDIYTRHKDEMGHVLGLAKYYFPIYEKAFREMGIPDEIKYLSIVESKLDPYAVSRVGATGPWQFMAATAKLYGLANDNYVDDRRDPIQASYAAAAYLKDAYMEFGDWLLAIASYNCGKSNVERAIEKAGALDFWSIRQYLPLETRGYVPAYIAVAYVMNYAKKHNIPADISGIATKTDTVMVNRFISLGDISKILNVDTKDLALLNPSYKRQIINGSVARPRRLIIPKPELQNYTALYNALNTDNVSAPAKMLAAAPVAAAPVIAATPVALPIDRQAPGDNTPDFYVVKRGETLVDIAANYGIELQDLKDWNNISGSKVTVGKKLWLNSGHESADVQTVAKSEAKFIFYKVKPGDTLNVIADKFGGNSPESIRSLNGLKKGPLLPGTTLKISRG